METTLAFNHEYDRILQEKYKLYKWRITQHLRKPENRHLVEYIKSITPLLDSPYYTMGTRIYWALNHIQQFPICQNEKCCKPLTKNITIKHGYRQKYCSYKCLNTSKDKQQKVKDTCLKRLGVENPFQSPEIIKKIEDTQIKKYGVVARSAPSVLAKKKDACLKKYGVEYVGATKFLHDRGKETCLKKYGVSNVYAAKSIKQKIYATWKKHGYDHPMHSAEIKKQLMVSYYERTIQLINSTESEYVKIISTAEEIVSNHVIQWQCQKCNTIFSTTCIQLVHRLKDIKLHACCPKCYPKARNRSLLECVVRNFISTVYHYEIITGKKSRTIIPPKELDIFLPEAKLAIEVDGLYWHADDIGLDVDYHLNKTRLCEERGIQLIHIFENEWMTKANIVQSHLKALLGIYDSTIDVQQCHVKRIQQTESCEFQAENSLQDSIQCDVSLGLFYGNKLISIMAFNKNGHSKSNEWRIMCFCNKLGYRILSADQVLLSYFEKHWKPISVVTSVDRRWSQGKLFYELGFKLDHATKPNYWYFKGLKLESSTKFHKRKLKTLLKSFDSNKTELQNMLDNGYHRIFDCGNLIFRKRYESS